MMDNDYKSYLLDVISEANGEQESSDNRL